MAHEQLEQQELGPRQLDHAISPAHLVGDGVEHEVSERQGLRLAGTLARPAQQRTNARLQLSERERFDQVVVGADVETDHAIVDPVARGQHQDRGAIAGLAHPPAHLEPVEPGHQYVEDHRVRGGGGEGVERLLAVGRERHVVAVEAQRSLERPPHSRFIVHYKYARHGGNDGGYV